MVLDWFRKKSTQQSQWQEAAKSFSATGTPKAKAAKTPQRPPAGGDPGVSPLSAQLGLEWDVSPAAGPLPSAAATTVATPDRERRRRARRQLVPDDDDDEPSKPMTPSRAAAAQASAVRTPQRRSSLSESLTPGIADQQNLFVGSGRTPQRVKVCDDGAGWWLDTSPAKRRRPAPGAAGGHPRATVEAVVAAVLLAALCALLDAPTLPSLALLGVCGAAFVLARAASPAHVGAVVVLLGGALLA